MTNIEQQPELKTEMNTATDPDAQPTWDANTDLSGLKGVTIPSTAPSFNEDPRRGRHWSPDNAIQADDDSLRSIFASLDAMPALQHGSVTVPDPMPKATVEQQPAAESQQSAQRQPMQQSAAPQAVASQSVAEQQPAPTRSAETPLIAEQQELSCDTAFPETPENEAVDQQNPQFDDDVTEVTPAFEYHGPIQQIDSDPPSFIPGGTPFAQQPDDYAAYEENTQTMQPSAINHIAQPAPAAIPQPNMNNRLIVDFIVPETNDSDEDAVPEQRKIKAQQVKETLHAEHPDADPEFVAAICQLVELNASDLHLVVNDPPMLRVDGKLRPAKGLSVWNKDRTYEAIKVMTNELEMERFKDDLELDISFSIGDLLRFRVNVYRDRLGVCAALRTIPTEIKTAQELGLDPHIADLALLPRGLVLVCGPTGSGKSTTLAAIVDRANAERADHIITIEDPIEFVHQHKRCVMSQREVGTDTKSFAEALKRALREDPDIIEVGELRDLETISTALTAVETGHLVFATLHTQDAGSTVDRLIDVYPENQQQQIRAQVASTLRAVVVQTLIPRASGHGRAPATEVMINTPAVAALIRGGKAHQIRTVLQSGEKEGMHTLDQDLARLVNKGVITFEDALAKVQILEEFEKLCGAFNTWLVMPSETLFTSTLSDGNMQFIALTPSELFMPCVMSCLMWCFLIQICLRRKTASLLLTTYLGISVAFTAHLSMHHAGIILGFFIAILAIDCDIEKINSNDWPQWIRNLNNRVMTLLGPKKTERYLRFFKILGLIFMLVSVYWTASASICDIRYDYSSSRAVASFIKTNHLEQYRWMAGWTRVSKNDTASNPEINKIIDKGGYCGGTDCIDYTSWYGSTLIDSAPYFDHTLLANAYKGRSYSSWEWCVDPYAGKKDIETWKSWGEPEFYDTLYQPFFFSDLGYDRNHYTKIKIAETKTPWKSTWSEGACEIYVRNDIYENVLHSPDPGIDWPDGATRR